MKRCVLGLLVLYSAFTAGASTEYFVAPGGNDGADGRSLATAFATIQRGVDALEPGDVVTIEPGEYREAVARRNLGSSEVETVIRARIPGTVLLRGDVPAPEFQPTPGYRFVYHADFPLPVQAVNELDTLLILETAPSVAELEFSPGRFHYDAEAGRLYISTTDFQPAQTHAYSVAVLEGRGGIFLQHANRVVVDGLTATGFNSALPLPRLQGGNSISDVIPWGFFLSQCTGSVLRNCTAFLNAGGLAIQSGTNGSDNVIEQSLAFANQSTRGGSGGNMTVFNPHRDEIRTSYAYIGEQHGIRMHGGSPDPIARFADNISWGHRGSDFQLKTEGAAENASAHRCVAPNKPIILSHPATGASNMLNSLVSSGTAQSGNSIILADYPRLDRNAEFADPVNMDFRLQATSRFRGAADDGSDLGPYPFSESVYFVTPDGDDRADGLSIASAWRTPARAFASLKAGDTLYFEAGTYAIETPLQVTGSSAEPITLRGRGHGRAVLTGPLQIENSLHLKVERLEFGGGVVVAQSESIEFDNCGFSAQPVAVTLSAASDVRISRSLFSGFSDAAIDLTGSDGVFLQGNIFDNRVGPALRLDHPAAIRYSDYNSYSRPAQAWRLGDSDLDLAAVRAHGDSHSVGVVAEFDVAALLPGPLNAEKFYLVSPLGPRIGFVNETMIEETPLRFTGPFVHSVSATTANIEWWSSEVETFTVEWGTTPEYGESTRLTGQNAYHPGDPRESFTSFSLQGLKPGTTYHLRVVLGDDQLGAVSFVTSARDAAPRTLYVATDGDDANDGTSATRAFRTLTHAAAKVAPGDVVMVGEGTYHEFVRMRATGDEGRAITFRSAPGAKVVMDGSDRTLYGAFSVANKGHITIDGFYFENFQRMRNQGVIRINSSNDILVSRCFYNGRGGGSPEFITIGAAEDITVRNCALVSGWDGIAAGGTRNLLIENNVIVRPSIRSIPLSSPDNVVIRNNIFTDNLASKRGAFLVQGSAGSHIINNCFFLRYPEAERPVFGRGARSLAEYDRDQGGARGNLVRDPQFRSARDNDLVSADGLFQDRMVNAMTDFPDLFATDRQLLDRGIGLQPEAFGDFHFNQ